MDSFGNVVTHVRMMASTTMPAMPVSTTPEGLLTAGEVSARYAEMRRRVNLFIPTSACLFRAMGDLCASAKRSASSVRNLPASTEPKSVGPAYLEDQD